ncbi:MAG TPA: S8 family serine peptidase, partial [Blastocatellia bacterium]|nr:S8 family serine peptidase [Blastocatellia bacterium]
MKKALIMFLAIAVAMPMFITSPMPAAAVGAQGPTQQEQRLLDLTANARGIPLRNLALLASAEVKLPLTGQVVTAAKILHVEKDELIAISFDARGSEVDLAALRRAEEQAHQVKYGKLDPFLYDLIQAKGGDEKVKVAFWLELPDVADERQMKDGRMDLSADEVERLIERRQEQLIKAVAGATDDLANDLRRRGLRVEEASVLTPVVYATLPVSLLEELARRADVQRIYFAENRNGDYMDIAAGAVRANSVWAAGQTGVGARVAIVEDSRVDFDNNCLTNNLGTRVPADANVDQHATATAGMVASNNATFRGIAPGAGIYSANGTTYSDANMSAALDAGASNADILNNSWGPQCGSNDGNLDVHARHADYIVRYVWDTVVAAAGNNGTCGSGAFVDGVASGHNVIAVGNFNDQGTTSWSDDTMNSGSSYQDPTSTHGDREKPDVAAPGTSITSLLLASPGTCPTGNVGSGTSYSSPMVAGIAGLLEGERPALKIYPETIKALIMAGATNNIEGSARLSDVDGAGGVNAVAARNSMINDRYRWFY